MELNYFEIQVDSLSEFALAVFPGEIAGPSGPVQTGTAAEISVDFFDIYVSHNLTWDWGDSMIDKLILTGNPVIHSHVYQMPGVYTLKLTIIDEDTDDERSILYQYIVVFDPAGGFVTGGGWIWSLQGAFVADPSLEGKATFGFVSKYKKGANVPTGNTEFQFKVADLNFHSVTYDWLVVTGSDCAKFKGTGTINGMNAENEDPYKFMIRAGDGSPDTFRIKIWWEETDGIEQIVYDNGLDIPIGGGSIVVHKN